MAANLMIDTHQRHKSLLPVYSSSSDNTHGYLSSRVD